MALSPTASGHRDQQEGERGGQHQQGYRPGQEEVELLLHITSKPARSTAGNLNFNDELLALDREVADYVIVHELLHFFVPNHGKLWKSLMRAHLGDYETLASKLPALRTD